MSKSNVLVIVSDEHQHGLMGCAGNPLLHTPNLDALAARGTRFTQAYTSCPICVPARSSLATGQYVHRTRCWDNAIAYEGTPRGWAQIVTEHGMIADSIGKLHYKSEDSLVGLRHQYEPVHILDGVGQVWASVRDPLPEKIEHTYIYDEIGPGLSSYNRFDQRVAAQAADWLRIHQDARQPWVLYVGFVAPHFPLVVPQSYLDRYPLESIPDPELLPEQGYVRHPWVERMARYADYDGAVGSPQRRRLAIACYYALVSFLDDQVGLVLQALDAYGMKDSTTVVYTSDHGDNLGKRAMWNKCLLYRESTGIPMIVAGPGIPAGATNGTPASIVDLHNTILDCTGIGEDPASDGVSLRKLARQEIEPRRIVLSEYHALGSEAGAFMLADGRYKYHYYVGLAPELFDLENDPAEADNLAPSPEYAEVLARFEIALRQMLDPEAVDREAKSDQRALVERFGGREVAFRSGTPGATPVP